jgi:NAD(P)-dependent dehydrogenase (short-subunit alcohol dehydrogenase family)
MRSRDGGIDRIPLPDGVPGALWLCGKHHIAEDVDAVVARTGATAVVCLTRREELSDRYPRYETWLDGRDAAGSAPGAIWFPIDDLSAPDLDVYRPFLDELAWRLRHGEVLVVHCAAGIGRAGTTAVALLLLLGVDVEAALATVRAHRPMAGPEVGSQLDLITELARTL